MKDEYSTEINPNSPECHNKNPENAEYAKMGFMSKEDYECHVRRQGDRKKAGEM